jgi:hypothetical protein
MAQVMILNCTYILDILMTDSKMAVLAQRLLQKFENNISYLPATVNLQNSISYDNR